MKAYCGEAAVKEVQYCYKTQIINELNFIKTQISDIMYFVVTKRAKLESQDIE